MQAKRQVAGPLNLGGTLWRVGAQLAEGLFAPKAGVVVQKIVGAVGQLREDRIPGVSNRPHGEEGIKSPRGPIGMKSRSPIIRPWGSSGNGRRKPLPVVEEFALALGMGKGSRVKHEPGVGLKSHCRPYE